MDVPESDPGFTREPPAFSANARPSPVEEAAQLVSFVVIFPSEYLSTKSEFAAYPPVVMMTLFALTVIFEPSLHSAMHPFTLPSASTVIEVTSASVSTCAPFFVAYSFNLSI